MTDTAHLESDEDDLACAAVWVPLDEPEMAYSACNVPDEYREIFASRLRELADEIENARREMMN